MITVKEKIRLVEACFGKSKISNDNKNIIIFCPECKSKGKDKFKLAIGIEKGIYHCWVCEAKGKNIGRLALKFTIQKKSALDLYNYYKKDTDDDSLRIEKEKIIALPGDFRLISAARESEAKPARAYLKNRGFKEEDISRFRIGISNDYFFRNRVIFPSFDDQQKLNFFTARSILKDVKKRYYNCSAKRKDIIFKENDIDFSKELIVTEGVFDLLNSPVNATCLLGSWIGKDYKLFRKIVSHKTPVILCLDEDAALKTQKIAKLLYSYGISVKISNHKGKDFGDMSKNEIDYHIKEAKPFNNVTRISYLIKEINSGSMF